MIKLTPQQSNRLAISQQLGKIKLLENALEYIDVRGNSILFGRPVGNEDLVQARNFLVELDRKRSVYESDAYQKKELPYLSSNGSGTEKIKDHFSDGELIFFEVKPSTSGKSVKRHQESKSHIKSRIKQNQMAQKKKAAAKKKVAVKKKAGGPTLKSLVDDMAWDGKTNAQIVAALNKKKVQYSIKSVMWYASKARQTDKDAKKK